MDMERALRFVEGQTRGVLVTLKRDGRPQLSNVMYACDAGLVRVSVTAIGAKTRNASRDPRVSLHVTTSDFWSYVVIEGMAELSAPAGESASARGALRAVYRRITGGEHADWGEFDQAMVQDHRQVLTVHPEYAYGALPDV